CGDRVEIKGCQDLDWIPRIIRLEMARQLHFYRLANELRSEAELPPLPSDRELDSKPVENRVQLATSNRIPLDIHELSGLFSDCESEMVSSSIEGGSSVLGIALPGFSGRLGKKTPIENDAQLPRLGRELASSAKMAGVPGIFHSDELPSYGIGLAEVDAVRSEMVLSEEDAFVLCVAPRWQGELALEAVVYRARMAFHRIPQEVRNVVIRKGKPEDGTTTALRPLPGGARMYPETDIPVLEISPDRWSSICENLPLTVKERKERLNVLDLSPNQVEALLNGEIDDLLFHGIDGPLGLPPKAWASALLESGTDKPNALAASVHLRERGLLTREGAETLLAESVEAPAGELVSWMSSESESRGFLPADTSSIEEAVDAVIRERSDFIEERGMGAVGPLMGMVMQKLGGSADGKAVSKILRDRIDEKIG
ncbi:MAG: GatB/YqeY domain-containing protein, partial [Candidatus Thalassarchaeaceae archaeon]|nr:GatB/YqeY domain-containing protein [Candidatus Thalassarchaeaceae archaeon]